MLARETADKIYERHLKNPQEFFRIILFQQLRNVLRSSDEIVPELHGGFTLRRLQYSAVHDEWIIMAGLMILIPYLRYGYVSGHFVTER